MNNNCHIILLNILLCFSFDIREEYHSNSKDLCYNSQPHYSLYSNQDPQHYRLFQQQLSSIYPKPTKKVTLDKKKIRDHLSQLSQHVNYLTSKFVQQVQNLYNEHYLQPQFDNQFVHKTIIAMMGPTKLTTDSEGEKYIDSRVIEENAYARDRNKYKRQDNHNEHYNTYVTKLNTQLKLEEEYEMYCNKRNEKKQKTHKINKHQRESKRQKMKKQINSFLQQMDQDSPQENTETKSVQSNSKTVDQAKTSKITQSYLHYVSQKQQQFGKQAEYYRNSSDYHENNGNNEENYQKLVPQKLPQEKQEKEYKDENESEIKYQIYEQPDEQNMQMQQSQNRLQNTMQNVSNMQEEKQKQNWESNTRITSEQPKLQYFNEYLNEDSSWSPEYEREKQQQERQRIEIENKAEQAFAKKNFPHSLYVPPPIRPSPKQYRLEQESAWWKDQISTELFHGEYKCKSLTGPKEEVELRNWISNKINTNWTLKQYQLMAMAKQLSKPQYQEGNFRVPWVERYLRSQPEIKDELQQKDGSMCAFLATQTRPIQKIKKNHSNSLSHNFFNGRVGYDTF